MLPYPSVRDPERPILNIEMFESPPSENAGTEQLVMGPNIQSLPRFDPLPRALEIPVVLKVGDDISTDEILPAGARVLPFRSNIPRIAEFLFERIDETYHQRALASHGGAGHAIVAGANYGQGSSREHAALAPRYLGLRVVFAKSFARIHWQNLINFGVLPLTLADPKDYGELFQGDILLLEDLHGQLARGADFRIYLPRRNRPLHARHALSPRQIEILLAGGLINLVHE